MKPPSGLKVMLQPDYTKRVFAAARRVCEGDEETSPRPSQAFRVAARIEREKARMASLDERIAQLMSARVDIEEKLAVLYILRDRKTQKKGT